MKLAQARSFALALPEANEEPHFHYTSFRVRGKIFATAPPEEKYLHIFVGDEDRERALAMYPEFIEKLPWGDKIVGLRITLTTAKPSVVRELLKQAWMRKAPATLVRAHSPQN